MYRRSWIVILILIAVGLFVMWNTTVRGFCAEITYPFQRMGDWMSRQVSHRFEAAWRGLCDGAERMQAAQEIERLQIMLQASEALVEENAALRAALEWKAREPRHVVAAEVWSYGGGLGVWPRLTLGIGSEDGVSAGDAVVVAEGLVGCIAPGVSKHMCEVILLSDPACRVAVEVPGVAKGIVQGTQGVDYGETPEEALLYAAEPLMMRYVGKDVKLALREVVLTEGSGGLFPRGLVVGTVLQQSLSDTGLLSEVLIEPAVHPTMLRTVFVITGAPHDR